MKASCTHFTEIKKYIHTYRSVLAQLRSGILPLEIECGRRKSLEVEERKCEVCDQSVVVSEDESHFLFECSLYNSERSHFIETIDRPDLLRLENREKWKIIMLNENAIETGRFIWNILEKRKHVLFAHVKLLVKASLLSNICYN